MLIFHGHNWLEQIEYIDKTIFNQIKMNLCNLSFGQLISTTQYIRQWIWRLKLYYNHYQMSMTWKRIELSEEIRFVRFEETDIFLKSIICDYRFKPHPDIKIIGLAALSECNVWCRFNQTVKVRATVNIYKEYVPPFWAME